MKNRYLFLVAFCLIVSQVTAQIIYTDVSPDLTFLADQQYFLDVDNDSNNDYIIEQVDSTIAGNPLEGVQLRAVGSVNEAVYETGSLTFLKGFAYGDLIDGTETWTVPSPSLPAGGVIMVGTTPYPSGDWADGLEHYAALRFTTGPNQYYGWVRFTVASDGLSFTIMDYAYHSVTDHAVLAGAIVDGIEEENQAGFSWMQTGQNLSITNDLSENNLIEVFDITGKSISSYQANGSVTIDLSQYVNGVYFFRCSNERGTQTIELGITN